MTLSSFGSCGAGRLRNKLRDHIAGDKSDILPHMMRIIQRWHPDRVRQDAACACGWKFHCLFDRLAKRAGGCA
jgi:hypothetical protein